MGISIKGFSNQDLQYIYETIKTWVANNFGKSTWSYTDFFLDEEGYDYFLEQICNDKEIQDGMDKDEVIDIIQEALGRNMTPYYFQQESLAPYH